MSDAHVREIAKCYLINTAPGSFAETFQTKEVR